MSPSPSIGIVHKFHSSLCLSDDNFTAVKLFSARAIINEDKLIARQKRFNVNFLPFLWCGSGAYKERDKSINKILAPAFCLESDGEEQLSLLVPTKCFLLRQKLILIVGARWARRPIF